MKYARIVHPLLIVTILSLTMWGTVAASAKPPLRDSSPLVVVPNLSARTMLSASVDQLRTDIASLRQTLNVYDTHGKKLDTDLQLVIKALDLLDKMAHGLKSLDAAMTSAEKLLDIAKDIPQTSEQATTLSNQLKSIHPSVTDASTKVNSLNDKLAPTRQKLTTFDGILQKALIVEEGFDKVVGAYSDITGKAQTCINSLPAGTVKDGLQSRIDGLSNQSDPRVVQANKILRDPINAIDDIEKIIQERLRPLREPLDELDSDVENLLSKLNDIMNPLRDVQALFQKTFDVSFPYPSPTWRHPGRMKHYTVSIGFDVILKGSDAIKSDLKRMLGGALYDAAKAFGIDKLIKDLEDQAQGALKVVLNRLKLDVDVKLPGLGKLPSELTEADNAFSDLVSKLNLDTQPLNDAMQKIENDKAEMEKIDAGCK
jgi:CII-binding regulator of phage lambda lysogenization HflD